jgi:hypothetical protein
MRTGRKPTVHPFESIDSEWFPSLNSSSPIVFLLFRCCLFQRLYEPLFDREFLR